MRHTIVLAAALLAGITSTLTITSAAPMQSAPMQRRITVPAGTRILVRTTDALDTRNQRAGAIFTGTLETNVRAEDTVVVQRGATVHGRLAEVRGAGSHTGSSQLSLELTDIVINGTAYPIVTNSYEIRGRGEGASTARRVGGGAGLGALIGSIAGGGRGAAIGAVTGAGVGTVASSGRGEQINIASESLVEFRLAHPVALPVQG